MSIRACSLSTRLFATIALGIFSSAAQAESFTPKTRVAISGGFWEINGKPTFEGTDAEGLLVNARMVNAVFEDRNPTTCPKDFDPEKNTDAFIARVPEYVELGLVAFTIGLQGGDPGYEGALNSAFEKDGSLRPEYLARVARVIEACDRHGAAVILSCFYQRQDQVLEGDDAVRRAVLETVRWIQSRGYTNVILEIANEYSHEGFDHRIIRTEPGIASLIRLAREEAPELLVSVSGEGNGRMDHEVGNAASFYTLHFNSVKTEQYDTLVVKAAKSSKAIVCNEDAKTGKDAIAAFDAAVRSLCSWGYMNLEQNQHHPFRFEGAKDDPVFYAHLRKATRRE